MRSVDDNELVPNTSNQAEEEYEFIMQDFFNHFTDLKRKS